MRVSDPMHVQSHELLVRNGFGGGMWLRGGTAIGRDGTIYVSTGDGLFNPNAGDYSNTYMSVPPDLSHVKDYFAPSNWSDLNKRDLDLPSGGLLEFEYQDREVLAGGGKESVIYLLDAKSLGGSTHAQALYTSPVLANEDRALEEKGIWGSPAVWIEKNQQTWLYFPVWGRLAKTAANSPITNGDTPHGSILAFKLANSGSGKPALEPAWVSADMDLPDAPVVSNGRIGGCAVLTGRRQRICHRGSAWHHICRSIH
jgi:hypothetical protein